MRTTYLSFLLLLTLGAPTAIAQDKPVEDRATDSMARAQITWADPATMAETRTYNPRPTRPETWIEPLAKHLERTLERRLPDGERIEVKIVDVLRAGRFEPWQRGGLEDVRILRDNTPPRITLAWRRYDARGVLVSQGQQRLVDSSYGMRSTLDTDPLRFEKRMIDTWARKIVSQGSKHYGP